MTGVVGCGTMGAGIAEACARAGHEVIVRVLDDEHATRGGAAIRAALERGVAAGRLEAKHRDDALGRITFVTDPAALAPAGVVIEAVPERLDLKRAVFEELARTCPDAVLATNTSSLPVIELAVAAGTPERVLGLHFFNPAPAMRLVELAQTVATSAASLRTAREFAESLGKTVVVCRDRAGFIANLLLFPYLNEAVRLLDSGYAGRDDVDTAMRMGAGHPMGPLELIDLIGLDACVQVLESLHRQFAEPRYAPHAALRELVAAGFTGRKAGRGFYTYRESGLPAEGTVSGASPLPRPEREVRRIGVAGSGVIAAGVAEVAAAAGIEVTCWGRSEASRERAAAVLERSTARAVERGRLDASGRDALLGQISFTGDPADLGDADLVLETVVEDLAVKRSVFAELDRVAPPHAVLATTTSSLPVIELAAATARPGRVVGLHVFNPVPAMKLVELVRTVATEEGALAIAANAVERMGKTWVLCGDRAGFIVNRLLFPYLNDAVRMLEEGYASAEDVDAAMTLGCNHPIGPVALVDLVGLDVTLEIMRTLHRELLDPAYAPVPLLEQMVRAGYLGAKSGRGLSTT